MRNIKKSILIRILLIDTLRVLFKKLKEERRKYLLLKSWAVKVLFLILEPVVYISVVCYFVFAKFMGILTSLKMYAL